MKKFLNNPIPYLLLAICMFFCSLVVVQDKKQCSAINNLYGYLPTASADGLLDFPMPQIANSALADRTIYGASDTNEDDLIITFRNVDDIDFGVNYTIIGNDNELFEEFKRAFKDRYTSQTAIGKLVCIKLTSEDSSVASRISSGISSRVSLFFTTKLLSKEYSIVTADSPEVFKARDNFTMDDNYVTFENFTLTEENYIALIYNNAYMVVWICLSVFVVIFVCAIIWKIHKMHKEDPEYYAGLKREKERKKYYKQKEKEKQQQLSEYRKNKDKNK